MSPVTTTEVRPNSASGRRAPSPGAPTGSHTPVSFGTGVLLTKGEVFCACQALADADRALHRSGRLVEATALGDLFELLEQRLSMAPPKVQSSSGR